MVIPGKLKMKTKKELMIEYLEMIFSNWEQLKVKELKKEVKRLRRIKNVQ